MKLHSTVLFIVIVGASTLAGCAPYQPGGDMHSRVCNELNSKIIFSGNTSDTRKSEIEGADQLLSERTYERDDCAR